MSDKPRKLNSLIRSPQLEFLMEAHNGISAKIVEEAGFKGIWGSGLAISASLGVRDNNEASWTQILDVLEFMSDATSIPILLDGDTGYGNFNNVSRLVKKLGQRDIAGVCIEDKLFPKTNSFVCGEMQSLADIEEFCGKIRAAKDAQQDPFFSVVARTEAFIAGWGVSEALRRAEAYRQAGADAVLVHSKRPDPGEIELFMAEWAARLPVIIVPTKYYSTPTYRFRDMGVSVAIWANHSMRASVAAMQDTARRVFMDESLVNVERRVASVGEIFRLQGQDELKEAELKYLPTTGKRVNAIILAASQGDCGELTREIPKTLLKIQGKTVLSRLIEEFNLVGIKDITVVRGFAKEKITEPNIRTVDNELFAESKDLYSLYLAKDELRENTVISYGDIIFKSYVLNDVLIDSGDITLIVDADCENSGDGVRDFVTTDMPYSRKMLTQTVRFRGIGPDLSDGLINGEFIGLWKVTGRGAEIMRLALERMSQQPDFIQKSICDLFNEVSREADVSVRFIKGSWLDIDTIVDLHKAGEF